MTRPSDGEGWGRGMSEGEAVAKAAEMASAAFVTKVNAAADRLDALPRVVGVDTVEVEAALVEQITVLLRQVAERLPG